MRLPYLVAIRKFLAASAVLGLVIALGVTVMTAGNGWTDGWAALAQMVTFLAVCTLGLYIFLRCLYHVSPRLFPGLNIDTSTPDGFVETVAVVSAGLLVGGAVLNLAWLTGPERLW